MNRATSTRPVTTGLVLALLALILLPVAARAEEMPGMSIHDVARLEVVNQAEVSPDGTREAYTLIVQRVPGEGEDGPAWSELWVAGGDDGPRPFVSGEVNVGNIAWTADGSAITFLAKRGEDENKALYSIPLAGGEARRLLGHGDGIDGYAFSPDGKRLAFLAKRAEDEGQKELEDKGFRQIVFEEEWRPVELWLAEVEEDGVSEPRAIELEGSASELSWSPAGDKIAVALAPTSLIDDDYMSRRVHILDAASGEVTARIDTTGKLADVVWSPDGARLALVAGVDVNDPIPGRLMVVEATGGAPRELNPGIAADAQEVVWQDAETLLWIRAEGVGRSLERQTVDGSSETLLAAGGPIWGALSLAGDSLALTGQTPEHPSELYRWTLGGGEPERVTDSNPWLAARRLAAQEVVEFKARDGMELEGLLIRPLERAAGERVPLVLVVHGGPEAHFANGWLTVYSRPGQVLAASGFAVFYPNYRGSTGRGLEFAKTSQADPAGKEFDDLVDAVDHLIATGLVDGDKVGVTGGSYGGYATAWSSTRHSDRFAAGVMFVGISDKVSKIGTSDIPVELYSVHARRWPWDSWQIHLERSPIYHVEQARTPLLILGGDADPRVHPSQSLVLYRYLKILGNTPVRYVIYPGEKHGNRKAAARLDYSLRAVRWLEHYLKGPGGAPPAHELDYGIELEGEDEETSAEE
ncbi:MAG: prolyl oligopeptidase family serine peptidase [Thermoanaerobaculia bacterium]